MTFNITIISIKNSMKLNKSKLMKTNVRNYAKANSTYSSVG